MLIDVLPTAEAPLAFSVWTLADHRQIGPRYCTQRDAVRHAAIGLAANPCGFAIVHEIGGLQLTIGIVRPSGGRMPA